MCKSHIKINLDNNKYTNWYTLVMSYIISQTTKAIQEHSPSIFNGFNGLPTALTNQLAEKDERGGCKGKE